MPPLFSPLLSLALIASFFVAAPVQAAPNDSICELEGAGTELYPYSVASVEDFEEIGDCVGSGVYFQQVEDIDFMGTVRNHFGTFAGIYDGNGLSLANLQNVGNANYAGLFSELSGPAVFHDMVFDQPEVMGTHAGVLLGRASNHSLTVRDVRINKGTDGAVIGFAYAGALIGLSRGNDVVIERVFSTVPVSAAGYLGGLAGGLEVNSAQIRDVYIEADLNLVDTYPSSKYIGGLAGSIIDQAGTSIDSAHFSGTITNNSSTTSSYHGGLIGLFFQPDRNYTNLISNVSVQTVFATSTGLNNGDYYSGLVGVVSGKLNLTQHVYEASYSSVAQGSTLCDLGFNFSSVPTSGTNPHTPSEITTTETFSLSGTNAIQDPATNAGCITGATRINTTELADNTTFTSFDIETDPGNLEYPSQGGKTWVMEVQDSSPYGSRPTLMFSAVMGAVSASDVFRSLNYVVAGATDSKFDEHQTSTSPHPDTVWVQDASTARVYSNQVDIGNGLEDALIKTNAVFAGFGTDPQGASNPIADDEDLSILDDATFFAYFQDQCQSGHYSSTGFEEILTIQVDGQPVDILDCIAAPEGTYVDTAGATTTTAARAGHYVDMTGQSADEPCPAGFYQPDTGQSFCIQSGEGYSADTGSASRTQCVEGTYGPENTNPECLAAPPGTYANITGMSDPIDCPAGFYQPNSGQMVCLWAGAGFQVPVERSASRIPCEPGTYSEEGPNETCTEAPAGTFVAVSQATSATTVRAGYHTPVSGMTAEVACDPGTFQPDPGQQSCIDAEPGYYVPGSAATAQIICPAGETSNAGAVGCSVPQSSPSFSAPIGFTDGPVVTEATQQGSRLTIAGDGVEEVESVFIGETELEIISQVGNTLVIDTKGLATQQIILKTATSSVVISVSVDSYEAESTPPQFWTKQISPTEIKLYAKNIVGAGKVQFFHNGNEAAWVRAADASDPKLRVIDSGPMTGANYLVRTREMVEGKNVFEIYVDGERVLRRAQGN